MEINKEDREFEILGHKIKLSSDTENDSVTPQEVVDKVQEHVQVLMSKFPAYGQKEIGVMLVLELAKETLELRSEYDSSISSIESSARDALQFIEEVSPTTI